MIDDTAAAGTCVNCAISISETSNCQWWHHNRRGDRPSLWNPALLEADPSADEGAGSSANGEAVDQAQRPGAADSIRLDSAGLLVSPDTADPAGPAHRDEDPIQTGGATPLRSSPTLGRTDQSTTYVTPASARTESERTGYDPQNSVSKAKLERLRWVNNVRRAVLSLTDMPSASSPVSNRRTPPLAPRKDVDTMHE